MDKPEEKKPQNNPPGSPPRPPLPGKKPENFPKPSGPMKGGMPAPRIPLPGQKGPNPLKPASFPGTPPTNRPAGPPPLGSKPPMGMPPKPPTGFPPKPPAGFPPMPPMGNQPPMPSSAKPFDQGLTDAESKKSDLEGKISDLEKRLMEEREKVLLASLRSKEEEAVSAKVESSIKDIQDKLRREKKEQELDDLRRKAESRALEMERRLAEEREAWVQTLKGQLNQRDQITQEMETHFSSRLKDLEYRWGQEKSSLETSLKEREAEVSRVRQEMALKAEHDKSFWEDRLRSVTNERDKFERDLERLKDKFQQEKELLQNERQLVKEQNSRLENQIKIVDEQSRIERSNLSRDHESAVLILKQKYQSDIEQHEKQIFSLNSQLQAQTKELVENTGLMEGLKSQLAALQIQIEQFNARIAEKDRLMDRQKGQFQELEMEKQRLQSASDHAQSLIKQKEHDADETRKLMRLKEAALEETKEAKQRIEQEYQAQRKSLEDQITALKDDVVRERSVAREEVSRIQSDYEARIKALHDRLQPYETNVFKEYSDARDKVRYEMETLQKELAETKVKYEQLTLNQGNHEELLKERAQLKEDLVNERNKYKEEIETLRLENKTRLVELEQQARENLEEARLEKNRSRQLEETKNALEGELKKREQGHEFHQTQLTDREQEIERLKKNLEAIKKAFEIQRIKIPELTKEIDSLRSVVKEKGIKTQREWDQIIQEKDQELEKIKNQVRQIRDSAKDADRIEDLYKEKERVLKKTIEEREESIADLKNRLHLLDRKVGDMTADQESIRKAAQREIERYTTEKEQEWKNALESQKSEMSKNFEQELQQARFEAARDAVERVRAEIPSPEAAKEVLEEEIASRIKEEEDKMAGTINELKEAHKKEIDKLKWERETVREELKRTREARLQIEQEAQQLLQEAEQHYANELSRQKEDIKKKGEKSKGFFSSIGRVLDTPLIEFGKKDEE